MATLPNPHRESWPRERAGYEDRRTVAYAGDTTRLRIGINWIAWEIRLASLVAAAGMIWAVRIITSNRAGLETLWQTRGPLEICAFGLLMWMHAKWQVSTKLR